MDEKDNVRRKGGSSKSKRVKKPHGISERGIFIERAQIRFRADFKKAGKKKGY